MTTREEIEAEIRRVLAPETRAVELSHALFEQGTGLFSRLAAPEEERRLRAGRLSRASDAETTNDENLPKLRDVGWWVSLK